MVQKTALLLLGFVALVAVGILTWQLRDEVTGNYSASGGGRWYYGPQKAQMEPAEACLYQGYEPMSPPRVYRDYYGSLMSMCRSGNELVGVPLVQTIIVR